MRHGCFRSLPHIAEIVDELCFVRSMHTEHNNHLEGLNMAPHLQNLPRQAGDGRVDQLCVGNRESEFCRRMSCYATRPDTPSAASSLWANGYLPALYQGVEFSMKGAPVHHFESPEPLPPGAQREAWLSGQAQ